MLASPSSSDVTIIWLDARACLSEALDKLEMDRAGMERALSLKEKYRDRLADWQVKQARKKVQETERKISNLQKVAV